MTSDQTPEMQTYEFRSVGWWMFPLIAVPIAIGCAISLGLFGDQQQPAALYVLLPVGLFVANFAVLSIRVDRDQVTWRFGLTPIGRRISIEEIRGVEIRHIPWYWGWGIRWTRDGWLWRSSGLESVWIHLGDGKQVGVGTADPCGLVRAIERRR